MDPIALVDKVMVIVVMAMAMAMAMAMVIVMAIVMVMVMAMMMESDLDTLGFMAAMTVHLVWSVHTKAAFAILTVCCSIASWMAFLSVLRIEPNSSMQHRPRSANTNAPASRHIRLQTHELLQRLNLHTDTGAGV